MRQLVGSLRRSPGPLAGTLVALTVSAIMVAVIASLIGTSSASNFRIAAGNLSGTPIAVAGDTSLHATVGGGDRESVVLPSYRRVPLSLASRIAAVPGVSRVVSEVSFPVGLRLPSGASDTGASGPLTGYDWASGSLSPFIITKGNEPRAATDVAVGADLARADRLEPGDKVRLTGLDLPPFTVTGIAAVRGHAAAQDRPAARDSIFFTGPEAAALYGHPGQADLMGVFGSPSVSVTVLAQRIRVALGRGYTVATGDGRGRLVNLTAASDASQLQQIALGVGINIGGIALFVVAGAVALSVGLRRRRFALLRAVGATSGQVRRGVLVELAVLGLAGGLLGFLPGEWLASWAVRSMAGHGLLPGTVRAWHSPWILLIAAGSGLIVAEAAGWIAARRAGRARPAEALRESAGERWWPHPLRIILGLAALGGAIALATVTLKASAGNQLNDAFPLLMLAMAAVALLGPLLVALAELVLRLPARRAGGVSGRLAMADVAARPRRMASAVIPVALSVAMLGTVYFVTATIGHASITQGRQRLVAGQVVTAPGAGLSPAALTAIRAQPGVRDAVGLTSANVTVFDPDLDPLAGEAVSAGSLGSVLDLGVISGSLAHFGPGDVAVSTEEAGGGAMSTHVGKMTTVYLADGTPYRARVSAIYSRGLGFGDVMIPAAVAAGHNGSPMFGQILVRGTGAGLGAELDRLSARYPGLVAASRSVMNAQAERLDRQSTFINDMILWVVALLAAVTLLNTLVVATVERRDMLWLLRRVGATRRQLTAMTAWQSGALTLIGVLLGAGASMTSLVSVSRVLTGSWMPYLTVTPVLVIVGLVTALTLAATLGPTAVLLRGGAERASS
jgi:putative ABC transport system permease protein